MNEAANERVTRNTLTSLILAAHTAAIGGTLYTRVGQLGAVQTSEWSPRQCADSPFGTDGLWCLLS